MENLIIRRLATFDRVVKFGIDHPLTPVIAAATTLYTQVGTIATELRAFAGSQDGCLGQFRGATDNRQIVAEALRTQMRPINEIARGLDREQYPAVREKFRMPVGNSYEKLIARAQAFLEAIPETKALFVARGLPADFDEELQGTRAELIAVAGLQSSGREGQVGSTAALRDKSSEGLKRVRELRSILRYQYRNNPELLAAWNSVSRVWRAGAEPSLPAPSAPALPPAAPAS